MNGGTMEIWQLKAQLSPYNQHSSSGLHPVYEHQKLLGLSRSLSDRRIPAHSSLHPTYAEIWNSELFVGQHGRRHDGNLAIESAAFTLQQTQLKSTQSDLRTLKFLGLSRSLSDRRIPAHSSLHPTYTEIWNSELFVGQHGRRHDGNLAIESAAFTLQLTQLKSTPSGLRTPKTPWIVAEFIGSPDSRSFFASSDLR